MKSLPGSRQFGLLPLRLSRWSPDPPPPPRLTELGAERLPGRYIQLGGWTVTCGAGAGALHSFFSISPSLRFPSGQAQIPVTGKHSVAN